MKEDYSSELDVSSLKSNDSLVSQITERDQLKISILSMLNMDIEQAGVALKFIDDSQLRQQLFVRYFNLSSPELSMSERVGISISNSNDAISIFE